MSCALDFYIYLYQRKETAKIGEFTLVFRNQLQYL